MKNIFARKNRTGTKTGALAPAVLHSNQGGISIIIIMRYTKPRLRLLGRLQIKIGKRKIGSNYL